MADNDDIVKLVRSVDGIATLPHIFIRINQLVNDPDSSMHDIARVVSQDLSFSMRLLRVANSPFYGFSSSIDTVDKAVSVIGTSKIRSLALSMSVASSFSSLLNDLVSMDNFWRHSLYCAVIARILAKQTGKCDPEVMFTAGLLHDIGELIIFNRLPEQAREVLLLVQDSVDDLPMHVAERQILGFDHGQVGLELARQWNLPPMLEECIGYHHAVAEVQHFPREVALVHLANILAQMAELDTLDPADVTAIDPHAWELTGLGVEIVELVVREAQEEIVETEKLFIDQSSVNAATK
ncbi:MAG TPA: HDOD domain-containing protein [Gallionella sp.]|nr:HDOD domain-containing protein [Gallionella sp.]